jgi:transcription initiation factor TFIIB
MLKAKEIYSQRLVQKGQCSECGGSELITDMISGEVVCFGCGRVLKETMLNQTPEWRAFTPKEKKVKTRVGPPTSYTYHDKGLSTTFQTSRDWYGKRLSAKTRQKMWRLRKWDNRAKLHLSVNRNLSQAMTELTRVADKLHLPKLVKDEAAMIYRKILYADLVRGRSIVSMMAASVYAACRFTETPRKIMEIVKASSQDRKDVTQCYRLILRELNLRMPIDEPMKYISKIASTVGLNLKVQNQAMTLLKKARKMKTVIGKSPVGLAAATLYIASVMNGERVTQKDLAEAAGITEVTVRNRYKGLSKTLSLNVEENG